AHARVPSIARLALEPDPADIAEQRDAPGAGQDAVHVRDAEPQIGVAEDRGVADIAPRPIAAKRVVGLGECPAAETTLTEGGPLHVGIVAEGVLPSAPSGDGEGLAHRQVDADVAVDLAEGARDVP